MDIKVKKLNRNALVDAYGIQCENVMSKEISEKLPVGMTWCIVKPDQPSTVHKHSEFETFIVFKGKGKIHSPNKTIDIEEYDCIYLDKFQEHQLVNTTQDDLVVLSIWGNYEKENGSNDLKDVILTSTPPTPNGDLHLGHLSGPYLAADVLKRVLQMQGINAQHYTGADVYQNYVVPKAISLKEEPMEVAKKYAGEIRKTLDLFNIEVDKFLMPNEVPNYKTYVHAIFNDLFEKGYLVVKESTATYSEDGTYLFESLLSGECPSCGSGCSGNLCEDCGMHNDCSDLKNPKGTLDNTPAVYKKVKKIYFSFEKILPRLLHFFEHVIADQNIKVFTDYVIKNGLKDYPVSHVSDWGINVPVKGYEDQIISSWFEMAAGHLIAYIDPATGPTPEVSPLEKIKEACSDSKMIQFFGFDNSIFNVFLFPSIYMALDLPTPYGIKMNKFLQLDSLKFSTSRAHAIWGKQIAETESTDVVRFYLSWINPESGENNFTLPHFNKVVDYALKGSLKKVILDTQENLADNFDNKVPYTTRWLDFQEEFYLDLQKHTAKNLDILSLDHMSLNKMAKNIFSLSELLHSFHKNSMIFDVAQHVDFQQTQVALELLGLKVMAMFTFPIMPSFSETLWKSLGFEGLIQAHGWDNYLDFVPSGIKLEGLSNCLEKLKL